MCDGFVYNTEECGFDEGDCKEFNSKHPDCYGVDIYELGGGVCQHNTEGCNFDGGDCQLFNAKYPKNCIADKPGLVGDGECNNEYDTIDCSFGGGDCLDGDSINVVLFINNEAISVSDYRKKTRTYSIIQTMTSLSSLIASITIIWIIKRSYDGLSKSFHRFLFGLSVADILSSLAQAFSTLPPPARRS